MAKMKSMNNQVKSESGLYFIKLGGSLITNKDTPRSPRLDLINQLAHEIASLKRNMPNKKLVIGHGSGSYGHVSAKRFQTKQGVRSPDEWQGFFEVWRDAAALNHLVMDALHQAELPAISFPISSAALTRDGTMISWELEPLRSALGAGLLPVVYGDVVFDTDLGGTILSTEDIFRVLALNFLPEKILLTGSEEGVWLDFPQCTNLLRELTPLNAAKVFSSLYGATAPDVTGGMASKVKGMLDLVKRVPELEVIIFSGLPPTNITEAAQGNPMGTRIKSD